MKQKINKLIAKCHDCGPVTIKEYREQVGDSLCLNHQLLVPSMHMLLYSVC